MMPIRDSSVHVAPYENKSKT